MVTTFPFSVPVGVTGSGIVDTAMREYRAGHYDIVNQIARDFTPDEEDLFITCRREWDEKFKEGRKR